MKPGLVASGRRFRIAVISAACVAVVAIGVVVGVFIGDQGLRDQVEAIGSEVQEQPDQVARAAVLGNDPGSLAGGGVLVTAQDDLFVARSSGIRRLDDSASSDADGGERLIGDQAVCMNYVDGDLYYIVIPATSRDTATEGTSIRVVKGSRDAVPSKASSRVLRMAEGDALIGSLSVSDGQMFFLERDGESYRALSLPCDAQGEAAQLDAFEAKGAWLFVEGSMVYEVIAEDSSWMVKSGLVSDSDDFAVVAQGEGRLAAACLHDGVFYYSLDSGPDGSHLFRNDLKGGSKELDGPTGAVRITASDDKVVVVTKQGGMFWFDAVTGFSHDSSTAFADALPNAVPSEVSLGLLGNRVYVASSNDAAAFIELRK